MSRRDTDTHITLDRYHRIAIDQARGVLADSQQMDVGAATVGDLCGHIGRLEAVLSLLLDVVDDGEVTR